MGFNKIMPLLSFHANGSRDPADKEFTSRWQNSNVDVSPHDRPGSGCFFINPKSSEMACQGGV